MRELFSGNEAIALGAYEGGCTAAFGYPGTPSTEILENLVKYPGVYCEWSPNEKVAFEAAAGAAYTGVRSIVTMKHVGLNVAADPMMTLSYIGVVGGMVICVADDPGQHSSQTEQDTRQYARMAKLPILEPANAGEARDFMIAAFEISEKHHCPVILRTTTSVSHSRSLLERKSEIAEKAVADFKKEPSKFVPLPLWGRKMRINAEERLDRMAADACTRKELNYVMEGSDKKIGIISSGITAFHCRELFPDAPILKLGWAFPFPDELIREFAATVDKVVVIEEADPILEEHIKSLGIPCDGKNIVPRCGELTPSRLFDVKMKLEGKTDVLPAPVPEAADLPSRPPVFCPGCPHRALFYALGKFDVIVTGDIGCYTLGVFPPLNRTDTCLCMGGGFTVAHGMEKAGEKKKIVGVLGDSTFFHSGITGLIDVVYNKGTTKLIVLDNRITAMTGHQEHPGTGKTLMGEPTKAASIEGIAKACGMERIFVCDPFDQKSLHDILKQELENDEPALIISRAPCPLHLKKRTVVRRKINADKCKNCKACLKCGCPAIAVGADGRPYIEPVLCAGCELCESTCKFGAIEKEA